MKIKTSNKVVNYYIFNDNDINNDYELLKQYEYSEFRKIKHTSPTLFDNKIAYLKLNNRIYKCIIKIIDLEED